MEHNAEILKKPLEIPQFYLFKAFKQLSIPIKDSHKALFLFATELTLKIVSVCERKFRELRPLQMILEV